MGANEGQDGSHQNRGYTQAPTTDKANPSKQGMYLGANEGQDGPHQNRGCTQAPTKDKTDPIKTWDVLRRQRRTRRTPATGGVLRCQRRTRRTPSKQGMYSGANEGQAVPVSYKTFIYVTRIINMCWTSLCTKKHK